MAKTLNEIILSNAGLSGCLPEEIGSLTKLTVFDVSFNSLVGSLPKSMGNMKSLEQLNVAHNKLSGAIPDSICSLPRLENFTYSDNYFCVEPSSCLEGRRMTPRIVYLTDQNSVLHRNATTFIHIRWIVVLLAVCRHRLLLHLHLRHPPPSPSPPPPPYHY
ncbi:UNVERIFIED_CONTAM: hypothetical protein Sradi_2737400 [Sesamum radiatum]|uniref:Uncharacterized protein n=1 Tax=Sesamum radiatum TaxID=300843 RepID=A0AAW2SA29_SESRA